MCGIAGIFHQHLTPVNPGIIKNMLHRIAHRGPDESGIYSGPGIGIGNVRLSIIDITGGSQPMSDVTGRYRIVFNGEIFNYIELKKELQQKGIQLKTNSDTEVLVQLYAIFGEQCLYKLNGQFAFAIWDKMTKELFLARDRVGIRPLFYYYKNETFTFGSEIKAILESPEIAADLNYQSLKQIFTCWTTLSPNTIFKDIKELPPGHFMKVTRNNIHMNKYWELDFSGVSLSHQMSLPDALDEFSHVLNDAVRIRLRADVPVAAYVSGGLDSSIITSVIKNLEPDVLQTFSIGFENETFDETPFQREVSKYLNTHHVARKINNHDIASHFKKVIWHSEIPLLRTAPTPMMLLSEQVRESNIKVVMTGEGADEMFGGYNIFKEAEIRRFWARQPHSTWRPSLLKKLYPYLPQMANANVQALKFFFGYKLQESRHPLYSHLLRWHNTSHVQKYLSREIREEVKEYHPLVEVEKLLPEGFTGWDQLSKAQWLESTIFMSGYLLSSQGDRMAMANSVEGRYPFLDHRVVEFAATLPDRLKLNGLNEKYVLKKYIKGKIPDSVVKRPKQAYRAPVSEVFLNEHQPEWLKEIMNEGYLKETGIFDPEMVKKLMIKLKNGGAASEIDNMALTGVISTQILYKQFIDGNKPGLDNSKITVPFNIVEK